MLESTGLINRSQISHHNTQHAETYIPVIYYFLNMLNRTAVLPCTRAPKLRTNISYFRFLKLMVKISSFPCILLKVQNEMDGNDIIKELFSFTNYMHPSIRSCKVLTLRKFIFTIENRSSVILSQLLIDVFKSLIDVQDSPLLAYFITVQLSCTEKSNQGELYIIKVHL